MEPTDPCRTMPVPGKPGSLEERPPCRLSGGMTLEGNHIALTTLDTAAVLPRTPWPTSEFTGNAKVISHLKHLHLLASQFEGLFPHHRSLLELARA